MKKNTLYVIVDNCHGHGYELGTLVEVKDGGETATEDGEAVCEVTAGPDDESEFYVGTSEVEEVGAI